MITPLLVWVHRSEPRNLSATTALNQLNGLGIDSRENAAIFEYGVIWFVIDSKRIPFNMNLQHLKRAGVKITRAFSRPPGKLSHLF